MLIGLSALAVLLQGVWAGIFLQHSGQRSNYPGWIEVHARGADVALALGIVAFAVLVWKLRDRRDLLIGTGLYVVGVIVESYLGGRIREQGDDVLTVVHIPLALALMALAVWLPLRARHARRD